MSLFEVISEIENVEIIAVGSKIRDLEWLRKTHGQGRWRKLKGLARIRFTETGEECEAELHWYEAHGIGKKEMKIKNTLD